MSDSAPAASTSKVAKASVPPSALSAHDRAQERLRGMSEYRKTAKTYEYVANFPLDLQMTEQAAGALLEAVSYHGLAHRHELLRFLCVLERVHPYLDAEERESVKPLREIWALKKVALEKKEQAESRKEFDAAHKHNRRRTGWDEQAAREKHERTRAKMVWGDPPAYGRPELSEAEKSEENDKLARILGISEEPLPWSAWALHESPQERVAAAARYIGTFQYSRDKAIEDEVLLLDARRTAMELLVEGGRINEEVARFFLEAYEGRVKEEEQGKSLGKGKGKEVTNAGMGLGEGGTRAMEAALMEAKEEIELDEHAYDLSDPEGFDDGQDNSEEEDGGVEETESESEGEEAKEAGSENRRK